MQNNKNQPIKSLAFEQKKRSSNNPHITGHSKSSDFPGKPRIDVAGGPTFYVSCSHAQIVILNIQTMHKQFYSSGEKLPNLQGM